MARAKRGDKFGCAECGLVVVVDEGCGCATADILCCGEPMVKGDIKTNKTKKAAAKKAPKAKAAKKAKPKAKKTAAAAKKTSAAKKKVAAKKPAAKKSPAKRKTAKAKK